MPTASSEKKRVFALSTVSLAYLGDAVYEAFVRERILRGGENINNAQKLHRQGVAYVRADSQARCIAALLPALTEEETALVMRARNHRIATKAKNADPMDYKWATAFEALLGALHLSGERARCLELMTRAAEIVEGAAEGEEG